MEVELSKLTTAAGPIDRPPGVPARERLRPRREHNLPSQRSALLGRAAELAAIKDMLLDSRVRLMTMTGAGGTGKTRLAIQVGDDLASEFDAVRFVNLAPIADSRLVASAVAGSLGVRESGDLPLVG